MQETKNIWLLEIEKLCKTTKTFCCWKQKKKSFEIFYYREQKICFLHEIFSVASLAIPLLCTIHSFSFGSVMLTMNSYRVAKEIELIQWYRVNGTTFIFPLMFPPLKQCFIMFPLTLSLYSSTTFVYMTMRKKKTGSCRLFTGGEQQHAQMGLGVNSLSLLCHRLPHHCGEQQFVWQHYTTGGK